MIVFERWIKRAPGDYYMKGVLALNIQCMESVTPICFDDGSYVFKVHTMSGKDIYVTPLKKEQEDLPKIFKFFD